MLRDTYLSSLPLYTGGQLVWDDNTPMIDYRDREASYDCVDPRTWPIIDWDHFDGFWSGVIGIWRAAHSRDVAINVATEILQQERTEVRTNQKGMPRYLNTRFYWLPYTYDSNGLLREWDHLPAADLVRWVVAVTGKQPVPLSTASSPAPESSTEAFQEFFAILNEEQLNTAFEVDTLKSKLKEVEMKLAEEREKASAKNLEKRLQNLQKDYDALQETQRRSNHTRRTEGYTHNKAIADATAKVKTLEESLAERDQQLAQSEQEFQEAQEELAQEKEQLMKIWAKVKEPTGTDGRKRKAADDGAGPEPKRKWTAPWF
ncbi:hypothetical protein SLS59_004065 [Nothophoma quercina]|uniref:Uncharacterized protein n=1 Tax=Nothophoma quercina TaxID=749835 RepID=A0ABR3RIK0_9PLEO